MAPPNPSQVRPSPRQPPPGQGQAQANPVNPEITLKPQPGTNSGTVLGFGQAALENHTTTGNLKIGWLAPVLTQAKWWILVGHHQDCVRSHPQPPATDSDDEIEESPRVLTGHQNGEPGQDHNKEGGNTEKG